MIIARFEGETDSSYYARVGHVEMAAAVLAELTDEEISAALALRAEQVQKDRHALEALRVEALR